MTDPITEIGQLNAELAEMATTIEKYKGMYERHLEMHKMCLSYIKLSKGMRASLVEAAEAIDKEHKAERIRGSEAYDKLSKLVMQLREG